MKNILKQLNIKPENKGTSTGNTWLKGKGDIISSYSPVDGKLIASVSSTTDKEYSVVLSAATQAFDVWKNIPAPKRGEIVRQIGDELRKYKAPAGPAGELRNGKKPAGRLGRGAGDDRHLRFRRGPLAPAVWPDHAQRTPRTPHVRTMAPPGRRWHYFRIQLSGGGMVVECHDRAGMRRRVRVEALGKSAAVRHRLPTDCSGSF
jgi:hypothetical protein